MKNTESVKKFLDSSQNPIFRMGISILINAICRPTERMSSFSKLSELSAGIESPLLSSKTLVLQLLYPVAKPARQFGHDM
jgi:hypothetical protein